MNYERRLVFMLRFSKFYQKCLEESIYLIPYEFHRTQTRQVELYAKGRTEPGNIVTYKDGIIKKSKHQFWEALDCCLIDLGTGKWNWKRNAQYERAGKIAEENGLRWGGNWDQDSHPGETGEFDIYHFEMGA